MSGFVSTALGQRSFAKSLVLNKTHQSSGRRAVQVYAVKDGATLDRKLRVAVIGGGPSGACAAETLAKGGVETFLIERKMDNCKVRYFTRSFLIFTPYPTLYHSSLDGRYPPTHSTPMSHATHAHSQPHTLFPHSPHPPYISLQPCGGAIPICMVEEFDLPMEIIDRRVTKMKMISPSNREVDVGKTLNEKEWIGMCRREVFDDYLRKRAKTNGANLINGLFMRMDVTGDEPITIHYNNYEDGSKVGTPTTLEVDLVIGADGANSRVAKEIDAGEADYAIAFQERIRIPDDKMDYYKDLAEMYVGDDVSPDFYGWVFPKYDHVAVGTGTVVNKTAIKQYQQATRDRAKVKTEGGTIIRVEAHPIPEHPRPRRCKGRVALVGDAAGYVTKCSGEGIYFAAKSGRMAAEAIVEKSEQGKKMVGESAIRVYLDKWDKKYWTTYFVREFEFVAVIAWVQQQLILYSLNIRINFEPSLMQVLDVLQKVFYRSNPAREAFVEMCESTYVQKMTFDSYLYKTVVPGNPLDDAKLLVQTVGSLLRGNALRSAASNGVNVSFGSKSNEEKIAVN